MLVAVTCSPPTLVTSVLVISACAVPASLTPKFHLSKLVFVLVLTILPLTETVSPQVTSFLVVMSIFKSPSSTTVFAVAVSALVSSTTGASAALSENVSAAGASVATAASVPSLNSAAHTGTLEVASIATTSDILNVFFAMPFFVFLIFVMIIVPLWVVDRLILWKKIVLSRAI